MKPRAIFLGLLLIASHAAAYYATSSRSLRANGVARDVSMPAGEAATKVLERGEARSSADRQRLDELLASDLSGEDFRAALRELLLEWVKRDLRGVLDLIYQPESSCRYDHRETMNNAVEAVIRKEMARQPHAVWHWIRSGRYGSNRNRVTEQWSSALIADGQRDVVLECVGEGSKEEQHHVLGKLCRRATAAEMPEIRKLLNGTYRSRLGLEAYAFRQVSLANDDVRQVFAGEEDPEFRKALCHIWVERTMDGLPPGQVAERLAELPNDVRLDALVSIAGETPREGMAGVVEFIGGLGRRGLWDDLEGEAEEGMIGGLVEMAYHGYLDTGDVFQQLGAIADAGQRAMAFRALGKTCAEGSPMDDPLEDLRHLPADANREEFLRGYLLAEDGREGAREKALEMTVDRAALEEAVREKERRELRMRDELAIPEEE